MDNSTQQLGNKPIIAATVQAAEEIVVSAPDSRVADSRVDNSTQLENKPKVNTAQGNNIMSRTEAMQEEQNKIDAYKDIQSYATALTQTVKDIQSCAPALAQTVVHAGSLNNADYESFKIFCKYWFGIEGGNINETFTKKKWNNRKIMLLVCIRAHAQHYMRRRLESHTKIVKKINGTLKDMKSQDNLKLLLPYLNDQVKDVPVVKGYANYKFYKFEPLRKIFKDINTDDWEEIPIIKKIHDQLNAVSTRSTMRDFRKLISNHITKDLQHTTDTVQWNNMCKKLKTMARLRARELINNGGLTRTYSILMAGADDILQYSNGLNDLARKPTLSKVHRRRLARDAFRGANDVAKLLTKI